MLLICVIGIIICGKAGKMKDRDLDQSHVDASGSEFKLAKGLIVAIISSVLSACFSFGIETGSSMGAIANEAWKVANSGQGEFLFRNNITFVVI